MIACWKNIRQLCLAALSMIALASQGPTLGIPDPYAVYGLVTSDEERPVGSGVSVAVINEGTGEWVTTYTNEQGQYIVDLSMLSSGYGEGDLLRINANDGRFMGTGSVSVNLSQPGIRVDLALLSPLPLADKRSQYLGLIAIGVVSSLFVAWTAYGFLRRRMAAERKPDAGERNGRSERKPARVPKGHHHREGEAEGGRLETFEGASLLVTGLSKCNKIPSLVSLMRRWGILDKRVIMICFNGSGWKSFEGKEDFTLIETEPESRRINIAISRAILRQPRTIVVDVLSVFAEAKSSSDIKDLVSQGLQRIGREGITTLWLVEANVRFEKLSPEMMGLFDRLIEFGEGEHPRSPRRFQKMNNTDWRGESGRHHPDRGGE